MQSKSIQEMLSEFIDEPYNHLCKAGLYTSRDFKILSSLLSGSKEDCFIWDNLGGKPFEIMINSNEYPNSVKNMVKDFSKYQSYVIFAYRIDGTETIVRELPKKY